MAKARVSTNPMYKGGAGGYTFYVRGGEQVLRQRKNNSNYGEGASRTYSQMVRRIRWGNLVNLFKVMKAWQPKAYDAKLKGQTDYNIFVGLNVNHASVGTTKAMNEGGCAVVEPLQVSRGSIPPMSLTFDDGADAYSTDVSIESAISSATTVGQLTAEILAANPQFVEGDSIAFIFFNNWLSSVTQLPYASSQYSEFVLDRSSSIPLSSLPVIGSRLTKLTSGVLGVTYSESSTDSPAHEVGFVAIHVRKTAQQLTVSSQSIVMSDSSLIPRYSGTQWDETCIRSFGITDEVMLEPQEPVPAISRVLSGDEVVADGGEYTGSHEIYVEGQFLTSSVVKVMLGSNTLTPVSTTSTSLHYHIAVAGNVKVYLGRELYVTFSVSGILPD